MTPLDQRDRHRATARRPHFSSIKTYGGAFAPYARPIAKPVAGSVRVAVDGVEVSEGRLSPAIVRPGLVTLLDRPCAGTSAPTVTAGFLFDVPVRFDTDYLEVDLSAFAAGAIPKIPLEIEGSEGVPRAQGGSCASLPPAAGQAQLRRDHIVPLLDRHAARRRDAGLHRPRSRPDH